MELCLGTAQFGMRYGINNKAGQPNLQNCLDIIGYAVNNGVCVLDTADAYGIAIDVLGAYLNSNRNAKDIKIISKLNPDLLNNVNASEMVSTIHKKVEQSLSKLKIDSFDGFMLHNAEHLYDKQVVNGLLQLKEDGLTKHIGVSIYDMKDGFSAIDQGLDYIQLPVNVFDQRSIHSGLLKEAQRHNIKIFARSVFLQGLFFMDIVEVSKFLPQIVPSLEKFNQLIKKYNISTINALFGFLKGIDAIEYLVFGAEKKEQVKSNIKAFKSSDISKEFISEAFEWFSAMEEKMILPNLWRV